MPYYWLVIRFFFALFFCNTVILRAVNYLFSITWWQPCSEKFHYLSTIKMYNIVQRVWWSLLNDRINLKFINLHVFNNAIDNVFNISSKYNTWRFQLLLRITNLLLTYYTQWKVSCISMIFNFSKTIVSLFSVSFLKLIVDDDCSYWILLHVVYTNVLL